MITYKTGIKKIYSTYLTAGEVYEKYTGTEKHT
jgi:hypothetical protein